MTIKNTVSIDFDPHSSIVKSVFDCRPSDVLAVYHFPVVSCTFRVQESIRFI